MSSYQNNKTGENENRPVRSSSTSRSSIPSTSTEDVELEFDNLRQIQAPTIKPNYQSRITRRLFGYGRAEPDSRTPDNTSRSAVRIHQRSTNTTPVNVQNKTKFESSTSVVPTYIIGQNIGNAIIINNINFTTLPTRSPGAECDEERISKLCKNLGFRVEVHRDLKVSDMVDKIEKFSIDKSLEEGSISVVIMMSHGCNEMVPGSNTQIYGTDGYALPTETVVDKFTADKCRAMVGKPKIFIFQCCRGDIHESSIQVDSGPKVRIHADMLIAYSTLPGFYSYRGRKGTWYIQALCEVFEEHAKAKGEHIEDLLRIVDQKVSEVNSNWSQTTHFENKGFKRCFLYPFPN